MKKTRTKTVEVQEEVFELTRDQLLSLKSAMHGGTALSSTSELLNIAAGYMPNEMANAARERAQFLTHGIAQINTIIWPATPALPSRDRS